MIKLNLGCGEDIQDGYDNIDIRNDVDDRIIVADVCSLPYEDGTVDEIRAIDVFEHVSYRKSKLLLRHWVKKLKDGGFLKIQAPSLVLLSAYALSTTDVYQLEDCIARIFGGQDYQENTH